MFFSPMEQYEIYPLLSQNLTLNNVVFYLLIAASIIITFSTLSTGPLVSTWWGILNESFYRTILSMIENFIGKKYTVYFPQIFTIFHMILFSNLQGLIPYSSTPTVEIVMTLSLSFTLQVGILFIGFLTHKLLLQAAFIPAGTPQGLVPVMLALEILAYMIKILSLGQRLAINMTTGHILMKVGISFVWVAYLKGTSFFVLALPLVQLTMFIAQEILIAYLQAYIFTFITCITMKDMAKYLNFKCIKKCFDFVFQLKKSYSIFSTIKYANKTHQQCVLFEYGESQK